jgi:tetratricopeptide (TPR) repeat protein
MKRFKTIRNLLVIAGGLMVTGYLRMPVEQRFTEDLRERKIVQPRIESDAWSEMGQTSLAGTFGGLRTVMASMLSLKAQSHFEENEWYDLKKDYEVITALDPYNAFYWSHGGWHIGYNAASWARSNREFSPARRRIMEMDFLEAGDEFYRKGLKYLPEEESLWFEIGSMWSNEYKRPDFERAAEAFEKARDSGNPVYRRRYLFTIARIPGREIEAYEEVIRLLTENPRHLAVPTFRCLLIVLPTNPKISDIEIKPTIDGVFRTREKAYQDLFNYRQRVLEEGFYAGNIDGILLNLIGELGVPDELNPFLNPSSHRIHTEHWRDSDDQSGPQVPDWMLKKKEEGAR